MTKGDSGSILRLVDSAQGGIAAAEHAHDYRAKKALHRAARVQAECAKALAMKELADAVKALVVTTEENP